MIFCSVRFYPARTPIRPMRYPRLLQLGLSSKASSVARCQCLIPARWNPMNKEPDADPIPLPVPASGPPGVLSAEVDPVSHAVMIDFDPRIISDEGVRRVAEQIAPAGHQQYCRTILHLEGRASGAAEQKLERKAQKIGGI